MKSRFRHIYLEITNICNLNCPFCSKDDRQKEFMSLDDFKKYALMCKEYTNSLYLHIKGEPLMHQDFLEMIAFLEEIGMKVKLTTNGDFLSKYQSLFFLCLIHRQDELFLKIYLFFHHTKNCPYGCFLFYKFRHLLLIHPRNIQVPYCTLSKARLRRCLQGRQLSFFCLLFFQQLQALLVRKRVRAKAEVMHTTRESTQNPTPFLRYISSQIREVSYS